MKLTKEQLKLCAPYAKDFNIERYLDAINQTLEEFNINTPKRVAAFLAQIIHESGSFRYSEEIATGKAYEGRKDLGNIKPGDGQRFKGRGLIQITGRNNYEAFSKFSNVDFVNFPVKITQAMHSARAAGWFWETRGLNQLADIEDFKKITQKINGGLNGYPDRIKHWQRCKAILNA